MNQLIFAFSFVFISNISAQQETPVIKKEVITTTYYRAVQGDTTFNQILTLIAKYNRNGDTVSVVRNNYKGTYYDKKVCYGLIKNRISLIIPKVKKEYFIFDKKDSLLKFKRHPKSIGLKAEKYRSYSSKHIRNEQGQITKINRYQKKNRLGIKRKLQFDNYFYDTLGRLISKAKYYPRYPEIDTNFTSFTYYENQSKLKSKRSSGNYVNYTEYNVYNVPLKHYFINKTTGDTTQNTALDYGVFTFDDTSYTVDYPLRKRKETRSLSGQLLRLEVYGPLDRVFNYEYNTAGLQTKLFISRGDSTFLHEEITYNELGQIIKKVGFDGITSYQYENGRLIKVSGYKSNISQTYRIFEYDKYGNLLSDTDIYKSLKDGGTYNKTVKIYTYTFYN